MSYVPRLAKVVNVLAIRQVIKGTETTSFRIDFTLQYVGGGGGIGYQVADTGPVGWVNFWPGCSLVPKY